MFLELISADIVPGHVRPRSLDAVAELSASVESPASADLKIGTLETNAAE